MSGYFSQACKTCGFVALTVQPTLLMRLIRRGVIYVPSACEAQAPVLVGCLITVVCDPCLVFLDSLFRA